MNDNKVVAAKLPARKLDVRVLSAVGSSLEISFVTEDLDRVDAFVNRRPQQSNDLSGPGTTLLITRRGAARALHLGGYWKGELSANRVLFVQQPTQSQSRSRHDSRRKTCPHRR